MSIDDESDNVILKIAAVTDNGDNISDKTVDIKYLEMTIVLAYRDFQNLKTMNLNLKIRHNHTDVSLIGREYRTLRRSND